MHPERVKVYEVRIGSRSFSCIAAGDVVLNSCVFAARNTLSKRNAAQFAFVDSTEVVAENALLTRNRGLQIDVRRK